MNFIFTPKEFEDAIRKAGQNPRGPTRASVEEVIRKYRDAYAKRPDGPLGASGGELEKILRGQK